MQYALDIVSLIHQQTRRAPMLISVLSERFVTITFMQVCEFERAKIVTFYALFQQSIYIYFRVHYYDLDFAANFTA